MSGFDNAAAYEVARLIHQARIREGASSVGRKIGFTNRDMWRVFGVHEPIWAFVYDTIVVHLPGSCGVCPLGQFTEPRIEPEVVLHFRAAPPANDDPTELLESIDWIAHGHSSGTVAPVDGIALGSRNTRCSDVGPLPLVAPAHAARKIRGSTSATSMRLPSPPMVTRASSPRAPRPPVRDPHSL